MKKLSKDTSIKVIQWNCYCARSTWIHIPLTDTWHKIGDREDIHAYHTPEDFDHAVIVVHAETYVRPQGWIAQIEIEDDTPVAMMTQSMRKSVLEVSRAVHDVDVTMWKHIDRDTDTNTWKPMANSAINTILRGCRTLALPLF